MVAVKKGGEKEREGKMGSVTIVLNCIIHEAFFPLYK